MRHWIGRMHVPCSAWDVNIGISQTLLQFSCTQVARDLYYDMVLGRGFEEMCAQMYYRGKMFGFVHLYSGQEAVSSGVIRAMRPADSICSTYRDHVHALSKGVPPRCVSQLMGAGQLWHASCSVSNFR